MDTEETIDQEWPDVIGESTCHEEYGRISDAIGELTAAMINCELNGILVPPIARSIYEYLATVLDILEAHMEEPTEEI